MAKIRYMMFFTQGASAPWRITQQIDHTWFLTIFGNENIGKPFNANEFAEFVQKNYDRGATYEMGDIGIANNCYPVLRFSEQGSANKFLADFTQILEKLA